MEIWLNLKLLLLSWAFCPRTEFDIEKRMPYLFYFENILRRK